VAFFKYFLIRAAVFLPLLVVFLLLGLGVIYSTVAAAAIAFCISYLFFRKQRDEAAAQLQHRFSGRARPLRSATEVRDANAEDALVDEHPNVVVNSDVRPPRPTTGKSPNQG
jgi:Protein of unknown function (DUF4229)